jgi:glycerol-3-phosphate dehydrogenase
MIDEVLAYAKKDESLLQPLAAAPQYLRVEVVYAVVSEAALHLEDVLARRTRIAIEYPDRGVNSAREVAELVAPLLDWDTEKKEFEIETYLARVEAEVSSQRQPDDESADALRAAAPESRSELLEPVPVPD